MNPERGREDAEDDERNVECFSEDLFHGESVSDVHFVDLGFRKDPLL